LSFKAYCYKSNSSTFGVKFYCYNCHKKIIKQLNNLFLGEINVNDKDVCSKCNCLIIINQPSTIPPKPKGWFSLFKL
jgi:hypothetical protein